MKAAESVIRSEEEFEAHRIRMHPPGKWIMDAWLGEKSGGGEKGVRDVPWLILEYLPHTGTASCMS